MVKRVPLAWRNCTSDLKRLRRAAIGIGFAGILILMQLGFREAFLESSLHIMRAFDGELVIASSARYQFAQRETFQRRRLYQAEAVNGVLWATPLLMEMGTSRWKSPITDKTHTLRVFATDPNRPSLAIADATAPLAALAEADTALVDSRARRFLGTTVPNLRTELAQRGIKVVGTFGMGPDFSTDGNLVMSERNFLKFFADPVDPDLRRTQIEYGIVKMAPGHSVEAVRAALRLSLPDDVVIETKERMIEREIAFQSNLSPTGPIFGLGTAIAFVVGILITYQILFTEISDRLHQFATLKAMGYGRRYLLGVIVSQSLLYGVVGFIPALACCLVAFSAISEWTLLPMAMSGAMLVTTIVLLIVMCVISGMIAARRALTVDPAEVF